MFAQLNIEPVLCLALGVKSDLYRWLDVIFCVMKYACNACTQHKCSENVICANTFRQLCPITNAICYILFTHREKSERIVCMVISDLQNFIILLQCIRAMPFSTQFHFWPTLKILRFDEDSVREQNNFPFLCSCVSAWHYHFCERTVEHAFSCIYDCESKCSSDSLRIFVYFVTIWYYQMFILKAQHTIHFE